MKFSNLKYYNKSYLLNKALKSINVPFLVAGILAVIGLTLVLNSYVGGAALFVMALRAEQILRCNK